MKKKTPIRKFLDHVVRKNLLCIWTEDVLLNQVVKVGKNKVRIIAFKEAI